MEPTELAAGVPAADGDLTADGALAHPHLDPRTDGVDVRRRLSEPDRDPVAHRRRSLGVAVGRRCATASRSTRRLTTTRSSIPSRLRSTSAAPRAGRSRRCPPPPRPSTNVPSAWPISRLLGSRVALPDLRVDVALADEQVDEAVVVDVLELRVPGGRREHVPTHERALRGDPALEGDVPVRRLGRAVFERLELVVALAREEHLGVAVAGQVLTGDAHAPDLQRAPSVGLGVLARRLAGRDPPQLLLARRGSSAGRSTRAGRAGPTGSSR